MVGFQANQNQTVTIIRPMIPSEITSLFNELLEYNAYFTFELAYNKYTGWRLELGNTNASLHTTICSLNGNNLQEFWPQVASALEQLKSVYSKPDGSPDFTVQVAKNMLLSFCSADTLNHLFIIKEKGFDLIFSFVNSNHPPIRVDTKNPDFTAILATL